MYAVIYEEVFDESLLEVFCDLQIVRCRAQLLIKPLQFIISIYVRSDYARDR